MSGKEEAHTRLAQLPGAGARKRETRHKMNADTDWHVRIVTSKMSCAQETRERVLKDSPRSKQEGEGDGS